MPETAAKTRTRRTETADVRRRQLLDAAKRRFRAVGFHATTMAEVAAEAGVSVGLIYQHFASKEALIEGIILEDLEDQISTLAKVLERRPKTLLEAIQFAARANLRVILDRRRSTLMVEIAAEASRNPKIQAFVAKIAARVEPSYQARLLALKPVGWSDEKLAARFDLLNAMMRGLALQGATNGGRMPSRATLRMLNEAAIWLFSPDGGEPQA